LQELIRLAHDEMGYSQRETHNGRRVPPLPLKVLGYLRVVGRGHSFDDVEENTGISETAFRVFFHDFSERGARFLYPMFVSMPSSAAEIRKVEEHYARVGMPGCCGSTDVVHVWWDACPAMLRSAHKGKESYPTRAFSVLPVLICVRGVPYSYLCVRRLQLRTTYPYSTRLFPLLVHKTTRQPVDLTITYRLSRITKSLESTYTNCMGRMVRLTVRRVRGSNVTVGITIG
jgi:hypothetical protein